MSNTGLRHWPHGGSLLMGILAWSLSGSLVAQPLPAQPPVSRPATGRPLGAPPLPAQPAAQAAAGALGDTAAGGLARPEKPVDLRLMVRETYSTNITLTPDQQSDFVTEVNPGIAINQQGARARLNLDYEMQNVFYANNSGSGKINNYLTADGNAELVPDHLFLDGFGYIQPQYLTSLGPNEGYSYVQPTYFTTLNSFGGSSFSPFGQQFIALNNNQTTAVSLGLGPYWRQNLGRYATALARYDYSVLNYVQTEGDLPPPSNAQNSNVQLNLNSGPYFSSLEWDLSYENQQLDRETTTNNTYENVLGRFRQRFSNRWALVGRAGYEDNDVPDQDVVNGGYGSLGPEWSPSRYISAAALYGTRDWLARLRFNPTLRTALEVERSNTEVGVNPGARWRGMFSHRTPHTNWSAQYFEETSTVQGVQFNQLVTVGQDQPLTPQPVFTLTNQDFFRRTLQASVTYQKGRSDLTLGVFDERREYIDPTDNETALGAGMAWGWRFSPRTRTILGGQWQQDDNSDDSRDQWWIGSWVLEYNLSRYLSALLGYRYYQREQDQDNSQENRLQLGLQAQF